MTRAIIIDDEKFCIEVLEELISTHCPEIKVCATCQSGEEGIAAINLNQPDLIFLDIEMPRMNGFDMLKKLLPFHFDVIFTTAYDNYAIRAFKYSALDYLLKPIDAEDLKSAVEKYLHPRAQRNYSAQIDLLIENIKHFNPSLIHRIAIPTVEGLIMLPISDIIYCEANSSYTIIHLVKKEKIVSAKTLKEYEELLEAHNFFRVHNSHLINLSFVQKYVKGDGGYVIMSDQSTIGVSRSRRESFVARLQNS
jgi:two-component system LytT family response regulator